MDIQTNIWVRERTKVTYIINQEGRRDVKRAWAGHITRFQLRRQVDSTNDQLKTLQEGHTTEQTNQAFEGQH